MTAKINLVFMLVLASASCRAQGHNDNEILEVVLNQIWIHSHEEDSVDVQAYREQEFDFPPSRGREGFQIIPDGAFIWYAIAPQDGTQKKKGRWAVKDGKLKVVFDAEQSAENFFLEFISLENGLLKARKVQDEP